MSEPASDGLDRLFTPPLTASPPPSSERPETPILLTESTGTRPIRTVYVEPPSLSAADKQHYKTLPPDFVPLGIEFDAADVDKVVGEYRDGADFYYFVKFKDSICHKMHASWFNTRYRDLAERYSIEKSAGTLDPFFPDGAYVHPRSRIKVVPKIPPITSPKRVRGRKPGPNALGGHRKTVPRRASESEEVVPDSEEGSTSEDTDDAGEYGLPARRSSRNKRGAAKIVPFSPRKTQPRRGFTLAESEDDEDDEIQEIPRPTRRSTRATTKNSQARYQDAEEYEDDDYESDSDKTSSRRSRSSHPQKKKKKVARGQASRPAYGNVREAADLAGDALSDEEMAPLRAHRGVCEKCHHGPADQLIKAESKKKPGKRKAADEDDDEDIAGTRMDRLVNLGGWVRCLKCPVVAHWGCLASTQQQEIMKAIKGKDREILQAARDAENTEDAADLAPIAVWRPPTLTPNQTTEFICGSCLKGGICMGCMEVALAPDTRLEPKTQRPSAVAADEDSEMLDGTGNAISEAPVPTSRELLFRCFTCKRLSHYQHLPVPTEYKDTSVDSIVLAKYYQKSTGWKCSDCSSFTSPLDKILAWRPYPSTAVEPPRPDGEPPHPKTPLPREYLVKWLDRSYRRTQWVPHMWLASTYFTKLKNFLADGPKVELLHSALPEEDAMDIFKEREIPPMPFEIAAGTEQVVVKPSLKVSSSALDPAPDADRRIPLAWKTIDRILDVVLLPSAKKFTRDKKQKRAVTSDEEEDLDDEIEAEIESVFVDGEEPSSHLIETVAEWKNRTSRDITSADIKHVVWAFIKWDDLSYEEATWDSPPRPGKFGYAAFQTAFKRFVNSRQVKIPKHSAVDIKDRSVDKYKKKYALSREKGEQPVLGQDKALALMPFQIDGFNWLCDNWWRLQHCILADEMGLGKTVQIITFLGTIMDKWKAFPALVVVPNSTITNWVREFEKWAPKLRVVPFYGESKSRAIIKKFELEHETKETGFTRAKFHVLVTTYESLTNTKDFTPVFKSVPRWEVLVVDEGQRLKNDSSILFKKLNELRTEHRIIMTGTPLNNNMRELFNLMNFLNPEEWRDLEALEKEHEVLTEDLIKQLHERLRPYFLRRIKSEVLQLPPKNEVIVPVSMAPLQKEVYRSILSKNLDILRSLTQSTNTKHPKMHIAVGKLNNMLMQLRKCLQHPYLIDDDIEPRGLSVQDAHHKLIDGSAKLRFLKTLLPQLKARGHRILLFSQFVIALDFIEDFLSGEGLKFLRLDGNTKQVDRQKGMDEFNKPDSDVFIYILSTRAGGVGINLWSADTVIIFDPDFNPHQDLQAIARAYRYGQKKTCLVFKLMVKDSAEERIMQTGKKKLVLDHLIVQKMDDEDSAGDDVQSVLTFGAKALFEEGEQGSHDITYSDADVGKLIEKTETEGDQEEVEKKDGLSFAFAKIWTAEKDTLEEMPDDITEGNDVDDSWTQTLARIAAEKEKIQAQEVTGRGVRRKAAAQQLVDIYATPEKEKGKKKAYKSKSVVSDESDIGSTFASSALNGSEGEDSDAAAPVAAIELRSLAQTDQNSANTPKAKKGTLAYPYNDNNIASRHQSGPLSSIHNQFAGAAAEFPVCSLCGLRHDDGACYMTESSENLVQYRELIMMHGGDEPIEMRQAAIAVIDQTLFKRNKIYLIDGQPLHLIGSTSAPNPPKRPKYDQLASTSAVQYMGGMPRTASSFSKRASSPEPIGEPSVKKTKVSQDPNVCIICGVSPFHLAKDCSVVLQGPGSIASAIKRLQDDPKQTSTVDLLSKILRKQKKQEVIAVSD